MSAFTWAFALQRPVRPPETSKHAGRPIIIIIKGTRRGVLDSSHGHNLLNNKRATAGGILRNDNSSLLLVENGLKEPGIPQVYQIYQANGGTFKRQLPLNNKIC